MANVLGELFGDIADAIREKTGDTATMKPAEFPAKISGIEAGGGGGSPVLRKVATAKATTGKFNERMSVDFGFAPDFLLVVPANRTVINGNFIFFGWSQKYKDTFGGFGSYYGSNSTGTWYCTSSGVISSTDPNTSVLSNADETGFTFGVSHSTGTYNVYAYKLI